MKIIKNSSVLVFFLLSLNTYAQISGNQVYGYDNSYSQNNRNNTVQKQSIFSTDTTLIINARILMNKIADNYLVSLGLNQEAKTVKDCNTNINKRIENLKKNLKTIGLGKDDIYSDFISQTKLYDYDVMDTKAKQIQNGFEIKKNLIIRLKDIAKFDKLLEYCAEEEIYDIIKVEYVDADIDNNYLKMYNEAISFIESRRDLYLKTSNQKLAGSSKITSDNFYSISPKTQYKKYEAFESTSLNVYTKDYSSQYISKEARKNKTFYYDGTETSGFDKIINSSTPEIGLQYVLYLTIVYDLKR